MPKPLIQTTGRRKEAVARVRIRAGSGKVVVNGRPVEQYLTTRNITFAQLRYGGPERRKDTRPAATMTSAPG